MSRRKGHLRQKHWINCRPLRQRSISTIFQKVRQKDLEILLREKIEQLVQMKSSPHQGHVWGQKNHYCKRTEEIIKKVLKGQKSDGECQQETSNCMDYLSVFAKKSSIFKTTRKDGKITFFWCRHHYKVHAIRKTGCRNQGKESGCTIVC